MRARASDQWRAPRAARTLVHLLNVEPLIHGQHRVERRLLAVRRLAKNEVAVVRVDARRRTIDKLQTRARARVCWRACWRVLAHRALLHAGVRGGVERRNDAVVLRREPEQLLPLE